MGSEAVLFVLFYLYSIALGIVNRQFIFSGKLLKESSLTISNEGGGLTQVFCPFFAKNFWRTKNQSESQRTQRKREYTEGFMRETG
jgi:hypothetical protein